MSRAEFVEWRQKFARERWGISAEDQRHANICFLLQNLINLWAKDKKSLKVEELFISNTKEAYAEVERMLYAIETAPWLDEGMTQEEIALEGQANFDRMSKLFSGK